MTSLNLQGHALKLLRREDGHTSHDDVSPQARMIAAAIRHSPELKVFFSMILVLLIGATTYLFRNRRRFFSHQGDPGDTAASANLRLWMLILILIHAIVISGIMIFEV